jgi:hypothetical protein
LCCVCCVSAIDDHGSRRADTVPALARWQRPVALHEALVVLHRAMCAASHQRIRVAIETASEPRVFFIMDN